MHLSRKFKVRPPRFVLKEPGERILLWFTILCNLNCSFSNRFWILPLFLFEAIKNATFNGVKLEHKGETLTSRYCCHRRLYLSFHAFSLILFLKQFLSQIFQVNADQEL